MGRARTTGRELVEQAETATQPASWDLEQRIQAPVGFLDFVSPRDS